MLIRLRRFELRLGKDCQQTRRPGSQESIMGVNVLVIEDDEPIALALVNGLRRAGFAAESGLGRRGA